MEYHNGESDIPFFVVCETSVGWQVNSGSAAVDPVYFKALHLETVPATAAGSDEVRGSGIQ